MAIATQQVSVDDLVIGMYVSRLDRPWTETPFLFQGFQIKNTQVIDKLRQHCKFVHIDVERSDEWVARALHAKAKKASVKKRKRLLRWKKSRRAAGSGRHVKGLEANKEASQPLESMKAELGNARQAFDETREVVHRMFDKLGVGQSITAIAAARALEPMVDSVIRNDNAMSWLARMKKKQSYLHDHSVACAVWAMIFGKYLGFSKRDVLALATGAFFMDVGKTRISTELLNKPGPLTTEEMAVVRNHVGCGVHIISKIAGIDPRVFNMVRFHHERHDGTGYPLGLSDSKIPLFARIAGIIDSYDAMTTTRPYAEAMSTYDAMRELSNCAGRTFDQELVENFVQALGVFPVGSLVELNTGEVGAVIAQNRVRRLKPKIMLLAKSDKTPRDAFSIIDLQKQVVTEEGKPSIWIEKGLPPRAYGLSAPELRI